MNTIEKINQLFEQSGKSARSILLELNFSETALSEWKKGKAKPTVDALHKIADYFNVSVDYLLGRTGSPETIYNEKLVSFPVLAGVAAGFNNGIKEIETGEYITIPLSSMKGYSANELFVFKVVGDSMSPKLLNDDKVLVLKVESVQSGDIAVVCYNDFENGTIKKVHYEPNCDYVDLIPLNHKYDPVRLQGQELETIRIVGKVLSLFRDL